MKIQHNDAFLSFIKNDEAMNLETLMPNGNESDSFKMSGPNFQIAIASEEYAFTHSYTVGMAQLPWEFKLKEYRDTKDTIEIVYIDDKRKIEVTSVMDKVPGSSSFNCKTIAKNVGDKDITLTQLSSLFIPTFGIDGIMNWDNKEKFKLHYCIQNWQGEGQWRSGSLEELGMYPTGFHNANLSIQFTSTGMFSTSRYLPLFIIEDMETSQVWFVEIEHSSNWHFALGYRGNALEGKGALFLYAGGADERRFDWSKTLKPGQSFESIPATVGCANGGFEEAVRELNKKRRQYIPKFEKIPMVFNDYMNSISADPTIENLKPLIDKVSETGCEYFCIDAGWFGVREPAYQWGNELGDWEPSIDRFGEKGLQGILDHIKEKGMIPGLWLEMEVCGKDSKLTNKPDSWFLMRNGERIGKNGPRQFLDFGNPEVRAYLHSKIDRLIDMGVGFFKNDYNNYPGLGC